MPHPPDVFTDRNVYILGAGFSRDARLPLLSDFLDVMRDGLQWLDDNGWSAEATSVREVLRLRLESSGAAYRVRLNVDNIEDLFSLAAAMTDDRLSDHIVRAIAGTLHYARQKYDHLATPVQIQVEGTPQPRIGWGPASLQLHKIPLYDYYLESLVGGFTAQDRNYADNTFVTFNYDTLLEESAQRLAIPVDYGFPPRSMRYAAANGPIAASSADLKSQLKILKLHGSMAWAYPGQQGKCLTNYGDYETARKHASRPCLSPPTWKKGDAKWLPHPWRAAVQSIQQATRLFLIGFSVPSTDTHFRFLLAAGLKNNISLRRIHVVNPLADDPAFRSRVDQLFPAHLREQGMLLFHAASVNWLCNGALPQLNRPLRAGVQIKAYPPF